MTCNYLSTAAIVVCNRYYILGQAAAVVVIHFSTYDNFIS